MLQKDSFATKVAEELIENWYELQRNLSLQVARDFIFVR